ncbi:MAG TPA: biopolymer transporter ExbD [Rhizomicrobium sp.]|jgi:biopolymer transport protein ExbD
MAIAFNGNNSGDVLSEMNTTPLIDVILVLLTLLIITLPMQTHAVKLALPHGTALNQPKPVVIDLVVDFDDTILWNGRAVNRATLDANLAHATRQTPQPELHIQPDRLARYDVVAKVLSDAQSMGVTKIGFSDPQAYKN